LAKVNPFKSYRLPALFLISLCGYVILGYGIERSNFTVLIAMFAALFLCYFWSIKWVDSARKLYWAIGAAILFRLVLVFALPTLSDDFYRFIWDGNLLANGMNPFAHAPEYYMQQGSVGIPEFLPADLFNNLNSQEYYTVYPPVSQYIYAMAASLFGTQLLGNVVVMKFFMLAAEIGVFWVMLKLLDHFELSRKWVLIYALNPLIILELIGNLHFEGMMIFFLLSAYYLFLKNKHWPAALCFLLAVNTKLIPLLLMPYLVFSIGWKRSAGLIGVLVTGTLALHATFLDQAFIGNFSDSLGLYFQSFEFNASLYYLVRWVGFQLEGYNIIQTAAPWLAMLSTAIIIALSWMYRQASLKNLPVVVIVLFGTYYLFSTTVHPWYISTLVAFVPLAGFYFPVIWSALIPLTYATYMTTAYTENLWLVLLEYIIVFIAVGMDYYYRK
jgi:hypothetical protein